MNEDDVRELLRDVEDPALGDDIVSLGLVNDFDVDGDTVTISLALGAPYSRRDGHRCPRARGARRRRPGVGPHRGHPRPQRPGRSPGVKNVVAVASGKGGVGKSTVAVNLAAGLADRGARVGLFDADIYGPNVPRMVDADDHPQATENETIVPPEKYGMKLMSMAFMIGEDDPVIWRGPMVHKVLTQLIEDVEWGHLDYLVVDLPPGTGDTQLTLLQTVPLTGAVVVTTRRTWPSTTLGRGCVCSAATTPRSSVSSRTWPRSSVPTAAATTTSSAAAAASSSPRTTTSRSSALSRSTRASAPVATKANPWSSTTTTRPESRSASSPQRPPTCSGSSTAGVSAMTDFDDTEKRDALRAVADELREKETEEAERIAALVHRVSDIYDDSEDTDPQHVYLNMRNILQISEQGGIDR